MTAESLIHHWQSMCRMRALKPPTPAVCLGTLAWSQPSPHTHWDTLQLAKHAVRLALAPEAGPDVCSTFRASLHLHRKAGNRCCATSGGGCLQGRDKSNRPCTKETSSPPPRHTGGAQILDGSLFAQRRGARTSAGTGAPHLELLSNYCTAFFYQQLSSSSPSISFSD